MEHENQMSLTGARANSKVKASENGETEMPREIVY